MVIEEIVLFSAYPLELFLVCRTCDESFLPMFRFLFDASIFFVSLEVLME